MIDGDPFDVSWSVQQRRSSKATLIFARFVEVDGARDRGRMVVVILVVNNQGDIIGETM
jgi:hypothetical protein